MPTLILKSGPQHRAGQRQRHLVADFVILRPAHDLPGRAGAIVHLAHAEPVGIRVWHAFANLRDDDIRDIHAVRFHAFHFHSSQREEIDELRHTRREFDEFAEPVKRDFHGKKRGSLPKTDRVFGQGRTSDTPLLKPQPKRGPRKARKARKAVEGR
ncbi:MAG: hypothetical protein WDN28_07850 [Chthoniobacter sp.]